MAKSNFNIDRAKTHILMKEKSVANLLPSEDGLYLNEDGHWDFDKWREQFQIKIVKRNSLEMEFDLIGIQAAIVNAFRRILLSDVPSMAFEKVLIYNNTSIIQDEVLAHRLGLIPLKADARQFEYRQPDDENGTDVDTLKYKLKVKCSWNKNASPSAPLSEQQVNTNVYSSQIKWLPMGSQSNVYKPDDVNPIHHDILIAKMVPGQEMDIELHAIKGIGRDHAKFSPVATAFYRLLPEITLLRDVEDDLAYKLQKCFSPGVIGLQKTKSGNVKAYVSDARYDTCSRNVFRHEDLKDAVQLERVKHHFIFTIESVGALPPDVLFIEAVRTLKNDCLDLLQKMKNMKKSGKKKKNN
ncbi:hypothetical protein R5R35_014131 [Gryllus longicercus]|uniref:DNA-directed RNA polymerases I and III subunit RPAC1 n=1 Tax=Gryllus longicercus TaxID=2509291 RepID=A0AAN9VB57_9ORTH|nr:Protein of unknown function [Gryllus bimaculatus]